MTAINSFSLHRRPNACGDGIQSLAGARDGSLMLWDSREPASWDDAFGLALSSPALVIHDAHKLADTAAESARKRRRSVSHQV